MADEDDQAGQSMQRDPALMSGVGSTENVNKIAELESEVTFLAEKATAASQRFADYENEIRVLQAQLRQQQRRNNSDAAKDTGDAGPNAAVAAAIPADRPGISRFGSFMHSRKASPVQPNGAPSSREKELETTLVKEQTARIAAERKVKEVNAEIEELSESLFQQANEMVADERKQNATLREKIAVLEQELAVRYNAVDTGAAQDENARLRERVKILEQRDVDRRRRLERLEAANKRIERVRTMLMPG